MVRQKQNAYVVVNALSFFKYDKILNGLDDLKSLLLVLTQCVWFILI